MTLWSSSLETSLPFTAPACSQHQSPLPSPSKSARRGIRKKRSGFAKRSSKATNAYCREMTLECSRIRLSRPKFMKRLLSGNLSATCDSFARKTDTCVSRRRKSPATKTASTFASWSIHTWTWSSWFDSSWRRSRSSFSSTTAVGQQAWCLPIARTQILNLSLPESSTKALQICSTTVPRAISTPSFYKGSCLRRRVRLASQSTVHLRS